MDGTEALHRIRQAKDGPNSRTPVICLTADAIIGARERYLAEGFSNYLSKPVNSRQLKATLMKYLPEGKIVFPSGKETEGPGERQPGRPEDGNGRETLRGAGIDPDSALRFCQGDEQLYRTLLTEFLREYPGKTGEIRRCFEEHDWKDYGIYVHALKSSARIIGAGELSDTAARQEAAANEGDEDLIRNGHEPMMARYGATARAIRDMIRKTEPEEDPEAEVFEFAPEGTEQEQ